jgi:uncharacterized protein (TIGR00369 family)
MTKEEMLAAFNATVPNTLMETLSMQYVDVDVEQGLIKISMPVTPKVHQPMGLLHGGATAALAESVGSVSSVLYVDREKFAVLGIELSCNHIRSKKDGTVYGIAKLLHKGRSTHLWEIRVEDEAGKLISHCKLTNMIVPLVKK